MAEIATAVTTGVALSALDAIKQGLSSIKVSRSAAKKVEKQLKKKLIKTWTESFETMNCTKIESGNIDKFLDYMKANYEGINSDVRKKMDGIKFAGGNWEHNIFEWKFNADDSPNGNGRFGMIVFGKSEDGNEIDCAYVLYKMDFTLTEKETADLKKHSILYGLINWNTITEDTKEISLDMIEDLQSFFRMKAMKVFQNMGLI